MEYKKYKIKILGTTQMLQNRMSRELSQEIKQIPRGQIDKWEEQNWKRKAYTIIIDNQEHYYFPDEVVQATLINACRKYRIPPPKDIGRTWTDYVKSSVLIEGNSIIETKEPEPLGKMVNGNPSSTKKSSRVYKVRPMFDKGWKCEITLIDLQANLDVQTIGKLFTHAGNFVGICDWRPIYGRFVVEKVTEVK